jgi:hypothetical protein
MIGEITRLIKDNLPYKHLIMSAEETFISFHETKIGFIFSEQYFFWSVDL